MLMIQELQKIFRSLIKSLEILYVIECIKPCARILVDEKESENVKNFLHEKGLKCSVSEFKLIKDSLHSENYSDFSIKARKEDTRRGSFVFYVSKDESCNEAKKLEEERNHFVLGKTLGYPECCCDFFAKNFDSKNTDLTLKALENSEGFEFSLFNNICARHFDVSLLSHFPCSFNCTLSEKMAQKNLGAIKSHSPQVALLFESMLKSAVVYTLNEGVFLLRKVENNEGEILYADVISTSRSKLFYLLSSSRKMKVLGKNKFFAADELVEGKDKGVMVFM
jgi:hypothetical protein